MPLGFDRLNERTQRPNALINFIKPLPGSTAPTAEAILNRVAAICYPFMKKHMILVQALEEFPFNNEFVGRNFNAGEAIQLVLRNRQGQWLPERWVMMVMVHELAHCKQMNHSKAFWKVRDTYAADLRELWAKGYTGEGLWGRGRNLETGELHAGSVAVGDVPEHLCGGTYGRKRKRKRAGKTPDNLTYAERKQRRILKKFGAGGQALGADEDAKVQLEGGVAKKGKPRVAGSARGRELRAAAALARFETVKKESTVKEEPQSDSETEDEYEDIETKDAAVDIDGKTLLDNEGRALVKICDDEDEQDGNARREMEEIRGIDLTRKPSSARQPESKKIPAAELKKRSSASSDPSSDLGPHTKRLTAKSSQSPSITSSRTPSAHVLHLDEICKQRTDAIHDPRPLHSTSTCTICTLVNERGSLTCIACSNVLTPHLVPNHWKCSSATCKESHYINSGDAGICGLCGTLRDANIEG